MAGCGCGGAGSAQEADATAGAGGVPVASADARTAGSTDVIVEPKESEGPPWLIIANVLGLIVLLFKIFRE